MNRLIVKIFEHFIATQYVQDMTTYIENVNYDSVHVLRNNINPFCVGNKHYVYANRLDPGQPQSNSALSNSASSKHLSQK